MQRKQGRSPVKHGGDLTEAEVRSGLPGRVWLDLSTGIGPLAFPYTPPADEVWRRLPQTGRLAVLRDAAAQAYGAPLHAPVVVAPGTQSLIQLLPLARPARQVAIVGPTYGEHADCWRQSRAQIVMLEDLDCPGDADVVVLVNPNNPDGRVWPPERVLDCAGTLAARGGLLVVDEAFADLMPEISVAESAGMDGLIVLRSFGKFFGLAGLRLGFALGPREITEKLEALLGPWPVSGPAIEIGIEALEDSAWQKTARGIYLHLAERLDHLLAGAGLEPVGGTPLYRLVAHPGAQAIHKRLAAEAIWVRRFDDAPTWLRFGLPGDEAAFNRLASALQAACG
jgi:cobalamin biosynthetic protein CobC